MTKTLRWALPLVALGMVVSGAWIGLAWAPPDREMGDVQRIMYVHVPMMWMMLIAFTLNFGASLGYLFTSRIQYDAFGEATGEVGLVLGSTGLVLGSIWARPTWGVWWTWDPRLTAVAVIVVLYAGYLALRRFVENPERRALMSAVTSIIVFADIPIIWFSVRWWRSLHQIQSSPSTTDPSMVFSLRWNAFALLAVLIVFISERYRIARAARSRELALPEAMPNLPSARGVA